MGEGTSSQSAPFMCPTRLAAMWCVVHFCGCSRVRTVNTRQLCVVQEERIRAQRLVVLTCFLFGARVLLCSTPPSLCSIPCVQCAWCRKAGWQVANAEHSCVSISPGVDGERPPGVSARQRIALAMFGLWAATR